VGAATAGGRAPLATPNLIGRRRGAVSRVGFSRPPATAPGDAPSTLLDGGATVTLVRRTLAVYAGNPLNRRAYPGAVRSEGAPEYFVLRSAQLGRDPALAVCAPSPAPAAWAGLYASAAHHGAATGLDGVSLWRRRCGFGTEEAQSGTVASRALVASRRALDSATGERSRRIRTRGTATR